MIDSKFADLNRSVIEVIVSFFSIAKASSFHCLVHVIVAIQRRHILSNILGSEGLTKDLWLYILSVENDIHILALISM